MHNQLIIRYFKKDIPFLQFVSKVNRTISWHELLKT